MSCVSCEKCSRPATIHLTIINTTCPDCGRSTRGQGSSYFGPACRTNCEKLGKRERHFCVECTPALKLDPEWQTLLKLK